MMNNCLNKIYNLILYFIYLYIVKQPVNMYINQYTSDIDECEMDMSGCSQKCYNTEGSFVCSCNPGYELQEDSRTCSGQ